MVRIWGKKNFKKNFRKVLCKSMDDMGIGEIVSEVLFGPNFLERFPAWQVSSLKKKFWFFCVSFVTEIGRSNPWQNPYIISNTFFQWKNEKSQNLFVTGPYQDLWRSRVVLEDSVEFSLGLFEKRFSLLKKFQIKFLWWWLHLKSWSSSSLSDSSPKEWNYQHMVMKHIR